MSFIHPDDILFRESPNGTPTRDFEVNEQKVEADKQYGVSPPLPTSSTPSTSSAASDSQRPEKVEIKIMLVKMQAESPLLPIKEHDVTEPNKNSSNNNALIAKTTTPKNISTKPNYSYKALADIDATRSTKLYDTTTSPNSAVKPTINTAHAITAPTTLSTECRRRSSITTTTDLTIGCDDICLNSDQKENNNNNKTNYYITSHTSTITHTHEYNLYPKDTFEKLEGKSPKPSNTMQAKVDAVGRITGEWGHWQLRTVLLIFLCKIPSSWFMACIIFTAPAPRHGEFFCKPPNTVGAQNHTQWIKVSHPQKEEIDDQEFSIDFCNVYKDAAEHAHHYYNYAERELEPRVWEEPTLKSGNIIPCTEFRHEAEFHSVVTQFDLVCSRDILISVTQFFHLFGVLTGGILANHLLKYFSPRYVMLFGMVTQIFCGNLTGYVASYELHVFFRCLSAVCCAQMYTAGGIIMADITGGKYRTCVSTLFEQFWSIGVMMLPGVASFFSSWSHLYMAISWPTVILIYLWQWIPDSPRWMIARGRVLDAKKILLQCVEVNGTRYSLPHDIDQQLMLQAQTAMDAPPPSGWWSIWKGEKAVRHMVCVHLAWSAYIVVYYGMLLNIRSFSREHLFVNTVVAGFSEMMGTFFGLFLILRTTRKWLWTGIFNITAGCIAYMGWLVPNVPTVSMDGRVALLMLSAMISKMAISTTLSILTTCTVELVSDDKKKITSFSTICWARFWLLGAPFIGATVVFGQLVPQTAFASLAIAGGVLTSFISSPRTLPKTNAAPSKGQGAQNMASQFTVIEGVDNKGYAPSTRIDLEANSGILLTKPIYANSTIKKLTTPQSNLPPQLMPGIWTTKSHDDSPHM